MYINTRWCNYIKVHERICSPNIELLTLSMHPFYLPCEFPAIVITYPWDLCYGNIESAFTAKSWAPLGSAYHNVYLIPKYRQLLKRLKPTTVTIQQWTDDTTAQLQGSFACTD
ncbi:unnamed protein product [Coregonus sp. 'balchen']|nr:unnamed protein product [Coregonus sp. 'balchen']